MLARAAAALIKAVPAATSIWLDGGHNPAAGAVLAESLPEPLRGRRLHLVVGMLTTKDLGRFLTPLLSLAASMRFVPVPGDAPSHDPETAASMARALGAHAAAADSVEAAVMAIAASEPLPFDVLICGSLYLAGEVLRGHR